MRTLIVVVALFGALAPAAAARSLDAAPIAHVSAVCADYPNQAAAQRAADTVDGDGDGIYCESLPCPCLKPGDGAPDPHADAARAAADQPAARARRGVQPISFSKTKYPNIKRHAERAIRKGWPSVLVLNRPGADARRDRLLDGLEHPRRATTATSTRRRSAAAAAPGLTRGSDPRGWKADVAYVPSSENRSHGSTMGIKLRRFCDGTKFQYVFY